jgi:outer membrane cobalamin receptor
MNVMRKQLLLAGVCSALMATSQVHAQESDVGELVVTGSRIKRMDIEGVGPATVIGSPEIAKSGIVNVETLLQRPVGARRRSTCAAWASTARSCC